MHASHHVVRHFLNSCQMMIQNVVVITALEVNGRPRPDDSTHIQLGSCLVRPENQKNFKILRHIESYGTCMKHYIDENKN